MTNRLHLEPRHRKVLEALLREHLPDVEVWAYGSRVNGRSHDGSDLDLVLRGPGLKEIPAGNLADFDEALQESNIPFLVESRDWARLPERFHQEIKREHVVLAKEPAENLTGHSVRFLGDVADIVMGQSPPRETVSIHEGIPLLNGPTEFGPHHPAPVQRTTAPKKCSQNGDILFCVRGSTTGRMNWSDQQYAIGRGIAAIRHKHDLALQPLVRAAIDYALPKLLIQATGSTFPNVSASQLATMPYPKFDRSEQRAIAHVLGALDDKIELNRRMNRTLEAMAQAIFKDWFVDFGPVRAKTEGREPYLPPEIWKLFPDALDQEGKPLGWMTYTLSDLAHHHRATLSPGAQPERIYEHYSIPAYDARNEPATDFGGSIKSNKTIVPEDAVLLSKLNPEIERVWLPNSNRDAPQIASTEFLTLTSLAPATRNVLYFLFGSLGFRVQMAARVTGTSKSHQRVPPKSLLACEVLTANPRLLALFDGKVGPMVRRLLSNRRESRKLSQARDLLLPKLISGQIRLRDSERLVGEIA